MVLLRFSIVAIFIIVLVYFIIKGINYLENWTVKNQVATATKTREIVSASAFVINESNIKLDLRTNVFTINFYLYPGSKLDLGDVVLTYDYYDPSTREIYLVLQVGNRTFDYSLYYLATFTEKETLITPPVTEDNETVTVTMLVQVLSGYSEVELTYKVDNTQYYINKHMQYPVLKINMQVMRTSTS